MTIDELLAELHEKNVTLSVSEDELVVLGKSQIFETSSVLDLLRENKKALIELVKAGKYAGSKEIGNKIPPNRVPKDCQVITPEMLPLAQLTSDDIARVVRKVPGGAANVQDIYPLAPLQEGMLFHYLLETEGDPYLGQVLYSFDNHSRLESFLQALQAVIDRHDILRTAVVWEGLSEPMQAVWRRAPLIIEEISFDPAAGDVAEQLRARYLAQRYRIDISQAPMMRAYISPGDLNGAPERRWFMFLLFHHLAIDHLTVEIVLQEVQAHLLGRAEWLPAPLPFRNFVAQARLGVSRDEHEKFFREMLADVDEPTAPFGYLGVKEDGAGIKEAVIRLEPALGRRLRDRARALGVSVASICHLAWARALARVSGQTDVVFGTVLLGRMQGNEGADRALGVFINTLPMRIIIGEKGVEWSVRKVHELLADLMRHEHASLALAQQCSGVEAPMPLFSSIFNFRDSRRAVAASPEVTSVWTGIIPLRVVERTNYPLLLSVDDFGDGFGLSAQAVMGINPGRVCVYMRTALEGLVEALERAPETEVRAIEVIPEAERRQVVEEWNATEADHPKEKFIHELFEEQAERSPHAVALIYEEQNLTYGELNVRANRLAHHLRKFGVGPEARVAMRLERSLEMVVAMLATLKAGGAYVPLDPAYPSGRLAYMLEDSEPAVLLTQGAVRSAPAPRLPAIPMLDLESDQTQWDAQSEQNPEHGAAGSDARSLAYIIYTSGSTGAPKGVMVGHANVVRLMESTGRWFGFGPADVWTLFHSYAFDFSVWEMWGALAYGGRLVIVPQATTRSPEEFHGLLRRAGVTVLNQTPSAFRQLISVGSGKAERHELRHVIFGGEALDVGMLKPWYGRNEGQPTRLVNMYGITETTVHVTCRLLEESDTRRSGASPIGRRIPDMKTYILGAYGELAPVGVKGELHVGGAGVARGYLNRPELTAERFQPDANGQEAGARIYKTGDLGRWLSEGEIEFLGRNDSQVKIRGYRIELGEIEAGLMSHPEVEDAVVIAAEGGVGSRRLIAYYTGREMGAEALRAHLAEALPDYMAPAAYVRLERMPLTPNGKLDRRALPAPEGGAYLRRGYEEPLGERERKLARIWAEALKLDRVGRNDNFFELGGHSLLAVRLVERMRREGVRANVHALYANPVLASFALVVGEESGLIEVPPNRIPPESEAITPEMLPLVELSAEEIEIILGKTPGGAANVQDIYPLAPLQEGMLFHYLLKAEGDPYLGQVLYSFDNRSRLDGFLQALEAVIDRHDILRTAAQWEGLSEPVQVVWRRAPLIIEEISLDPAAGDVEEQLRARYSPRHYRLDISQAPMMRIYIAAAEHGEKAPEPPWLMFLLFHHLVVDQLTVDIVFREVREHLLGRAENLPAPLPFRSFVAQARLGMSREEHEEFFRKMLADVDEPTAPYGLINAQGDGSDIRGMSRQVDAALATRLRRTARAQGVSVASLFHLAWARALSRVSGRDDVVFGTVLFGRMQGEEGADRAMGLFINTLPVRIRIGDEGVGRSVRKAHELLADLMRHEHASLALAQRCSGVEAPTPLFSSLLNYRHALREVAPSPEAASAWIGIKLLKEVGRTHYPLTISVDDFGDGFTLSAHLGGGIDPVGVLGYMRTALERLAEALENDPERAARAIEVMPEAERKQVVEGWNATEAVYPRDKGVHELFEEQVEKGRDRVALVYEEQSLTYAELNARANRLAARLREMGVGPEMNVAILLERSVELVVAELAILKSGGAYVPIDPTFPDERQVFIAYDSAARAVVTLRGAPLPEGMTIPRIYIDDASQGEAETGNLNLPAQSEMTAYVMYTSGSTGSPKGIMTPHRAIGRLVLNCGYADFNESDRVAFAANPAFDAATMEVWAPLLNGGRIVVIDQRCVMDPQLFASVLERREVSVLWLTVGLFNQYARAMTESFSQLRYLIVGGAALDPGVIAQAHRDGPPRHLVNGYGPTETTTFAITHEIKEVPERVKSIPLGGPISNTQVYILDASGQPAPVWVAGEIYIGGAGVAQGYLNRPEMTAERFLPDPFSGKPDVRLYKTGDLGRWLPEGRIEFLGRNDYQVKIRGFRVELGEIEAHLGSHPAVRQCVVVAHQDEGTEKRLAAYLVCEAETAPSDRELRGHLAGRLPDYMLPSRFVRMEQMPLTPNGKMDRQALAALEVEGLEERDGYIAPRTPVEEILVGIFEEVMQLDRVGIHDNFFEIGGHSLLAIQVISWAQTTFEVEINVISIFEKPTVEGLARRIEEAIKAGEKVEAPPLVRAARNGMLPLSFAQRRLWFIDQLNPGNAVYNIPGAVRLEGRLDIEALESAINQIVRRHEALRTRFEIAEGEPVQVIDEWRHRRLEVADLTGLAQDEREEEARRIAGEEARAGFDLMRGPLLRVKVLKLEEEKHVLLYTMHHIVSDEWSMGILVREVGALYQACQSGEESPLAELPIQYADFALWQREYLAGGVMAGEVGYWKKQLKDAAVLELPTDHARPATPSHRGGLEAAEIDEELSEGLKRLSQREGVTLFMALMAAFKVILMRYSGQEDVVVGAPIANRTRKEVEGLIGFFVNTLVLRTDLSGNPSFRELIGREREVALGAYVHQEAPFEKLVEEINPERDLSRSPLFQAVMTLQNRRPGKGSGKSRMNWIWEETGTAKFDLMLGLTDSGAEISGALGYSLDLFEGETIGRMARHYERLVAEVVRDAEQRIREIELMSPEEKRQIIGCGEPVKIEYERDRPIHQLFERQVENRPEAVAVVCQGEQISYRELNRRANQLARYLCGLGVGPEVMVGVCLERLIEMVVALIAVWKAAGGYLPLDPTYPEPRLRLMAEDAAVSVILTGGAARERLRTTPTRVLDLGKAWEDIEKCDEKNPRSNAGGGELAYVIYTSGSSGEPKGVMVAHRNLSNLLMVSQRSFEFEAEEEMLCLASFSFDISLFELLNPLVAGGKVRIVSSERILELGEFLEEVRSVDVVHAVPSLMREVIEGIKRERERKQGYGNIRKVFVGGELVPANLLEEMRGIFNEARIEVLYGPTEGTIICTSYGVGARGVRGKNLIGEPLNNTQIRICDERGELTPMGVRGELRIGGEGVTRGYLN